MKTVFIDNDALPAVLLREPPVLLTNPEDGTIITDQQNRRIYRGRVILPGGASGLFGPVAPRQVRIRTLTEPPALAAGSLITINGRATLTSWYQPRVRGNAASSELTLTCDNISAVDPRTTRPVVTGLLPVRPFSADPFPFIDCQARGDDGPTADGAAYIATLALPAGVVDEEGVVRLGLRNAPTDDQLTDLYVHGARIIGLAARFIVPDAADVGRSAKAAMEFTADRLEPAVDVTAEPVNAYRPRRQPVPPAPTPQATGNDEPAA